MPPCEDGGRCRAKIIKRIDQHKEGADKEPEMIKFRCIVNGEREEATARIGGFLADHGNHDDGIAHRSENRAASLAGDFAGFQRYLVRAVLKCLFN